MKYFILLISCSSLFAHATAHFHCYTLPGYPLQTYEYSSAYCKSDFKNKVNGKKIDGNPKQGQEATREILCLYAAACKPVSEAESKKEPPPLNQGEIQNQLVQLQLKTSNLVCIGNINTKDSQVIAAVCPSPSQCRKDVFYNWASMPNQFVQQNLNVPENSK